MIKERKKTQFILKQLSKAERETYAEFLALPDSFRGKLVEDGNTGRLSKQKYLTMYTVYLKVEGLKDKLVKIV